MPKNSDQDMGSEIGVLMPSALTESFEIVISRIADLNAQGVPVSTIVCDGYFKGCVANPFGLESVCKHCCFVREQVLADVAPSIEVLRLRNDGYNINTNIGEDKLQELDSGVFSTILTFYRTNVKPNSVKSLHDFTFEKIRNVFFEYSYLTLQSLIGILSEKKIKRLEFFNGRIVPTKAAVIAAQQVGVDFGVLEVSGSDRNLSLTFNKSVHDLENKQKELLQFCETTNIDLGDGEAFFKARRAGESTDARSFTNKQKLGLLKKSDMPIFAIFTSSADELQVAGSQWFTEASQNPASFINDLVDLLRKRFRIVVRMHPNQAGDKTGAAKMMEEELRENPYIELISPRSRISTYELLDASAVVLTFGSTIGLEATYWGKPSFLAGRALWDCLDVAYKVSRPKDVVGLVSQCLLPKSRRDAVVAGAYYMQGTGCQNSLSWEINRRGGRFYVNGKSYLSLKRSSFSYWISRIINKFLRLV